MEGLSDLSAVPEIKQMLDVLSADTGIQSEFHEMVSELDHLDELKDKFKVLATDFKLPEPLIDLTLSHLSQTAISSDPAEAIKEAFAAAQQDFLEIIQERGVQAPNELAKLEGRKAITPASAIVESGMDSKGLLY